MLAMSSPLVIAEQSVASASMHPIPRRLANGTTKGGARGAQRLGVQDFQAD